jgi:hypothetical protein
VSARVAALSRAVSLPLGGLSAVAAVLAAISSLLALGLVSGRDSLWIDEAITGLVMRQSHTLADLVAFMRTTDGSESAQSLYYFILWLWTRVAGDSEAALRLPSLLFMALAALAVFTNLLLLRLSRNAAILAAGSFLVLPVTMWYSLEARPYALVVLLASVHITSTLRYAMAPTARRLGVMSVLTVLIAVAYPVAAVGAFCAMVVVAIKKALPSYRATRGVPTLFVALATVATGAVVAAVVLFSLSRTGGVRTPDSPGALVSSFIYAGYELLLGRSIGYSVVELRLAGTLGGVRDLVAALPVPGFVALAAALSLSVLAVKGLRQIRLRIDRDVLLAVGPWLLTALAFCAYSVYPGFLLLGRHLLFVTPALFLMIAVGLSRTGARTRASALLVVWLIAAIGLGGILFDVRYAKDDFRAVAQVIEQCRFDAANVVLLASERGFSYYGVGGDYALRGRGNSFHADDPNSGDLQSAMGFMRQRQSDRALLVVDLSRYDRSGYIESEASRAPVLYRREVPSLTMFSTVALDGCAP